MVCVGDGDFVELVVTDAVALRDIDENSDDDSGEVGDTDSVSESDGDGDGDSDGGSDGDGVTAALCDGDIVMVTL